MKKTVSLVLALILALAAVSCGGAKKQDGAKIRDVSMYELSRAMLEATEFDEMAYVSSSDSNPGDLLANVSDIDYSKVLSFFIAYAADGALSADEIVVIALKDTADVKEASDSLDRHLASRKSMYATYEPSLTEKAGRGVVFTLDNIAVLIISDDNGAVRAAFDGFIDGTDKKGQ